MINVNNYILQIQKTEYFNNLKPVIAKLDFSYVIIKGEALSIQAYGKPGVRDYSDIDILVSRENIKNLEKELLNNDFYNDKLERVDRIVMLSGSHQTFPWVKSIAPWGDLTVDVNFDLFWGEYSGKKIDINEFISDAEDTKIYGVKVNILPKIKAMVELILHHYKEMNSIYHLAGHNTINLEKFKDVYYLWKNNLKEISLEKMISICEKYEIAPYAYYILYYTNVIYKDPHLQLYVDALKSKKGEYLLNYYGLTEKERKLWRHSFGTRVEADNIFELIKSDLTNEDYEKLERNRKIFGNI